MRPNGPVYRPHAGGDSCLAGNANPCRFLTRFCPEVPRPRILNGPQSTPRTVPMPSIVIRGARTHNLRNIDLELPRDKLIVFTGLSGSGKSSLAFDTIYAEGQRR